MSPQPVGAPTATADSAKSLAQTGLQLVVFGDSLSDSGTFGVRFTTHPGRTWAQMLGDHLGCPVDPFAACELAEAYVGHTAPTAILGGFNYAQGGARVALPYSVVSDEAWGIPWSAARQVDAFLRFNKRFSYRHLVVLFAGTNDVSYRYDRAIDPDFARRLRDDLMLPSDVLCREVRRVERAAEQAASLVRRMRRSGAKRILVLGTYDLAAAPWFQSNAARSYATALSVSFNQRLRLRMNAFSAETVRYVDVASFVAGLTANPSDFGLRFGAGVDACSEGSSNFCTPSERRSPTAHRDHVFAASVHFSTATHELLAQHLVEDHLCAWLGIV